MATCTISGNLTDIQGVALRGYSFYVRHIYCPIADGTTLVLGEKVKITANSSGAVSFNLIQGSKFRLELPDRIFDLARICDVPVAASANLADVLFPRVTALAFDGLDVSMSTGDTQTIKLTATMSDGTTQEITNGFTLSSSSTAVLSVENTAVTAVSSGTSNLSVATFDATEYEIKDNLYAEKIKRLNRTDPTFPTSTVTVT